MYSNPRRRGDTNIYRLRLGYRLQVTLIFTLFLFLIPLAIYGYSLNSKEGSAGDTLVYVGMIGILGLNLWLTYQICFIIRLETTPHQGALFGVGKSITFAWKDAYKLDYVQWPNDNKYQLCLYLQPHTVRRGAILPVQFWLPPIRSTENMIPLDTLYGYKSFFSLDISKKLPTLDEQSVHLRYFIRTPLGQDLIQYAPHIFGDALRKYLPDNDLAI